MCAVRSFSTEAVRKSSFSSGVTNDELFGIINQTTREWKDGLFSVIMRDQVNLRSNGPKWIVLDGKHKNISFLCFFLLD